MKKQDPENLKTRPDLDDEHWLAWTAALAENRGIDVRIMYRKMLEWCHKKGVTPTRRRLLRWLDNEREAVPLTYEPPYMKPAEPEATEAPTYKCKTCFDTGTKTVFPKPNSIEGSYTGPCPDCSETEVLHGL